MWTSGHLAGFYMFLWPQSHSVPSQLARGVGLHHGGMLPVLREITEKFFKEWKHRLGCGCLLKLFQPALGGWDLPALPFCCQEGLIRVLCTTETFAVGVNMPSRSIVFNWVAGNEFHKFDGTEQREIFVAEPWQHPKANP